jgi:regulator of replication initiation timing
MVLTRSQTHTEIEAVDDQVNELENENNKQNLQQAKLRRFVLRSLCGS